MNESKDYYEQTSDYDYMSIALQYWSLLWKQLVIVI